MFFETFPSWHQPCYYIAYPSLASPNTRNDTAKGLGVFDYCLETWGPKESIPVRDHTQCPWLRIMLQRLWSGCAWQDCALLGV
jgi:hypothetical protein